MSTQQELDAADMHLYRGGGITEPEAVEAWTTVRIFTGPGNHEFIEVRAHSGGWAEISSYRRLVIQPTASNRVMIKPDLT